MFRDTLTVYRKEIKSILKDKTVLFMCVLLPFIFMFGEGKLMSAMSDGEENERQKTYDAYFINAPEDIKEGLFDTAAAVMDKKSGLSEKWLRQNLEKSGERKNDYHRS